MARGTKTITLSLPPDVVDEVDRLTKEEGLTRSELFQQLFRQYSEAKEWRRILHYGQGQARKLGIREEDIEDIIDELRD